ncbi:MAG: outer membrane beta-barrel protein [Candidatus Nitrotoga sp.]
MLKRVFILMLAAAGLVAAPYASAETQWYVNGGLGFNAVASDVVDFDPAAPPAENSTAGKSNFTGQIEGGARFAMPNDDNIIFGIGLYINPFTLKADDINNNAGFSMATEIVDMRGLVGEVGWKLGASTVAYGKLSLNQAKVEVKINDVVDGISGTLTQDFSGVGFGAGVRQALANNMYLFTEWHHIMGSTVTVNMGLIEPGATHKIKPKLTTGLIGAGWTF